MKTYTEGPATGSQEWLDMRKFESSRSRPVVIGASEAAAACGRSRYCSPLELYLIKRGEYEQQRTPEQIESMEMGHALEPVILDRYEKRTGIALVRNLPMCFSSELPWIAATPDGRPVDSAIDLVVDAKRTTGRMFDKSGDDAHAFGVDGTDQIPIEYLFQAQQQCLVMGVSRVDFPVLFDGAVLRIYPVKRDEQLIAEIVECTRELADRIVSGRPPEPDYSHAGTSKLLQSTRKSTAGKVIEWGSEIIEKWDAVADLKLRAKEIQKRIDTIQNELMDAMADAESANCGSFTVKRIKVAASSYTVEKQPYQYLKASSKK